MDRITEGRIVHYVFMNRSGQLVCRPAIVVNAWNNQLDDQKVNLQVFYDGANDVDVNTSSWVTSVPHSEEHVINSWHWPIH